MFEFIIVMIILSLCQALFRKSFTGRGSRIDSNRLQLSAVVITEISKLFVKSFVLFFTFYSYTIKNLRVPVTSALSRGLSIKYFNLFWPGFHSDFVN